MAFVSQGKQLENGAEKSNHPTKATNNKGRETAAKNAVNILALQHCRRQVSRALTHESKKLYFIFFYTFSSFKKIFQYSIWMQDVIF